MSSEYGIVIQTHYLIECQVGSDLHLSNTLDDAVSWVISKGVCDD